MRRRREPAPAAAPTISARRGRARLPRRRFADAPQSRSAILGAQDVAIEQGRIRRRIHQQADLIAA